MSTTPILALPPGIVRIFEFMEIAEEEIADAKLADSSGAFAALVPPAGFTGLAPRIYRHHAREIVARVKAGDDVARATDAELLVGMLDAVTKAPPARLLAAMIDTLWLRVVGPLPGGHSPTTEPWPGAAEEELAAVRRHVVTARAGLATRKAKPRN